MLRHHRYLKTREGMDPSFYPLSDEESEFEGTESPLPSAIFPHCAPTGPYVSSDSEDGEFDGNESLLRNGGNEGMIGRDKAEAALGDLTRKGTIYSILCLQTNREYVGQTVRRVARRIREHECGRKKKKECPVNVH